MARTGVPTITPGITRDSVKLERYLRELENYINNLVHEVRKSADDAVPQETFIDIAAVRTALQRNGEYPLNVEGLLGVLSDPQIAGLLVVSTEPPASAYSPGTLMILTGASDTFKYCKAGTPNTWQQITFAAPSNMMTTDTNQTPGATVVKTWTARQIFNGGLDAGAQIHITSGGLDVDLGGINVDAGGIRVIAGGIDVDAGGINIDAGGLTVDGGITVDTGQFDSASQFVCHAYASGAQAITTGVATAINLDLEVGDVGPCHSNVTNNTRLTVPAGGSGTWLIVGQVAFEAVSTGTFRYAGILKNGTTTVARNQVIPFTQAAVLPVVCIALSVGDSDYFELIAQHDRGSNLNTVAIDSGSTFLAFVKLH